MPRPRGPTEHPLCDWSREKSQNGRWAIQDSGGHLGVIVERNPGEIKRTKDIWVWESTEEMFSWFLRSGLRVEAQGGEGKELCCCFGNSEDGKLGRPWSAVNAV